MWTPVTRRAMSSSWWKKITQHRKRHRQRRAGGEDGTAAFQSRRDGTDPIVWYGPRRPPRAASTAVETLTSRNGGSAYFPGTCLDIHSASVIIRARSQCSSMPPISWEEIGHGNRRNLERKQQQTHDTATKTQTFEGAPQSPPGALQPEADHAGNVWTVQGTETSAPRLPHVRHVQRPAGRGRGGA